MFKDKSKYPTLTRMSYCQCRLKLVFASIFRQFGWKHVALLLDRSDLFSLTVGQCFSTISFHNKTKIFYFHFNYGKNVAFCIVLVLFSLSLSPFSLYFIYLLGKNLEYGLKQEGLLSFVRELNGNEEEQYDNYLRDASMYARGNYFVVMCLMKMSRDCRLMITILYN